MDAVFVAFARNQGGVPADIKERVEGLKSDAEFASYSGQASADTSAVRNRLKLANKVLFGSGRHDP